MTIIRLACSATSLSCVTMTTVMPCSFRLWKSASTSSREWLSRLPVGSSASNSAGCVTSARATGDALLLPARQLAGVVEHPILQPHRGQRLCRPFAPFGP